VQLYSAQDLTGLSAMERAAQEQGMMSAYRDFDEGWLDKALASRDEERGLIRIVRLLST
jgi:hypothetical protein